jgi:SAM-dependent methyltransferase
VTDKFLPRNITWTEQSIARFWDWQATNQKTQQNYFSRMVGSSVLDVVQRRVGLRGTVVDVGAGTGFLTEELLRRRVDVIALDTSPESVTLLSERLANEPGFVGAKVSKITKLPLPDATADFVFLIETIEHLDDRVGQDILRELFRIARPGGFVVITTPHNEDLSKAEVMCPDCGCRFHTMQHMRSFTRASLAREGEAAGFATVVCEATLFSSRWVGTRLFQHLRFKLTGRAWPHLLYIGRRPK